MPERREESFSAGAMLRTGLQGIGMYLIVQFAMKQFMPQPQPQTPSSTSSVGGAIGAIPAYEARPSALDAGAEISIIPETIIPIWPIDATLDVSMYVSPSVAMPALNSAPKESLVLSEEGFKLGDFEDTRHIETSFTVPQEVQNNGTLWAHFYVGLSGSVLDPLDKHYDAGKAYHFLKPLNQFLAKKKVKKTKKLLEATPETEVVEEESKPTGRVISSYYHPNFTVSLIPDSSVINFPSLHPALRQWIHLESKGSRDGSGQNTWYYPIIYLNTFWQLRDHMTELNSTVKTLPLHITLNNQNNWKFSLYATIDDSVKTTARNAAHGGSMTAGGDGSEFEEMKRILVDTNLYLLGTTVFVSILHTIFEMLAFKSDISHWRNKKDNVGISVRTILANVFMQTIIFLYLIDNSDGTSWMILFGQGMGIVLEAWKITKTVDVRIRPAPTGAWLPYHVTFEDKHKLSETEEKTKEYDEIAFKYLYMVAVPLLGAYAVYSMLYDTHKSWYSFVITTLVGSVYAYGFLMMVPSLYINYRLKSVAHMPGKAMTYKVLNTFIDDLFAFTIKMPTLHRLATLRDDVIFFIYLYQSWKYKVDPTRVNEFGQGGEVEEVDAKKAEKPLVTPAGGDTAPAAIASGREKGTKLEKRK